LLADTHLAGRYRTRALAHRAHRERARARVAQRDTVYGAEWKLGWNNSNLGFSHAGMFFSFFSFFFFFFFFFFFMLLIALTQACLSVVWDHHADVYGLTCHPQRPFVFVSSSRDTTLRVWTMTREAARARVISLFGNTWTGVIGEVEAAMQGEAILAGAASRDLVARAKAARTEAQRAHVIFDFFSPPNGVRDLWDLVVGMEGKGEGSKERDDNAIVRNDELAQNTLV
jgi:WD40 repeat protein